LGLRTATSVALLFLLMPQVPIQSLLQSSQSPQQQAGTPAGAAPQLQSGRALPPGTVYYDNTWNQTLREQCTLPESAPSSLSTRTNSWSISLQIPLQLFDGSPEGGYVEHTYTVLANGTFLAADGAGNSYRLHKLSGLPQGTTTTSLRGNSTTALLDYLVVSGKGKVLANVTVSYSERYQFCEPAGLTIDIKGTANWGSAKTGTLSFAFRDAPTRVEGSRADYGNRSGVSIGFDWADSQAASPSFDSSSRSVSWRVGRTFDIDPTTVAESAYWYPTTWDQQRKTCFSDGLYWLFYSDGKDLVYVSSTDGVTWSAPSVVRPSVAGLQESIWCDSSDHVYYAYADASSYSFLYRYGTLNADGTVTWLIPEGSVTAGGYSRWPYISATSPSDVWVSVNVDPGQVQLWSYNGTAWTERRDVTESVSYPPAGIVIPLSSPLKKALVYTGNAATTYAKVYVTTTSDGGKTWSAPVSPPSEYAMVYSSAVAIGDTVEFAGLTPAGGVSYWSYALGAADTSAETALQAPNGIGWSVSLSTDGSANLVAVYGAEADVYYQTSTDAGAVWSGANLLTQYEGEVQPSTLTSMYYTYGETAGVVWTAGFGAPYYVRYAAFPIVYPDAATSKDSWAKPGLSPYEGYFSDLDEYVSPGNGLLGISQTDLDLPGRGGLDLSVARVFATPYAFKGASPYEFDNYTMTNLGYGWSLDFPWLGTNYLHLADGQAYPYQWNGDTFAYHQAVDFTLVNDNGSGYTLTLPSGTVYQFASNKQLTSITDPTGKNVISLAYGSNGYLSQITDTIGRVVALTYNGQNQLASISSGGRTWTYRYSGNDLVSTTDPAGRVTSYQYSTGINPWLVSAVLYPTGGKSTYTYGSAPITSSVRTYYVSSRNVYSSATALSQSSSISYDIVNGNVVWSNATISDGTNVQAIEDDNFQPADNRTVTYDKSASGALMRVTEQDYDTSGQITQTKLYGPTDALLSMTSSQYDNWGNVVETTDALGHSVYYSYANTNSQNTFGASGFSNSFFTTNAVIGTNIHDGLVGEAQFQNGPGSAPQETYFQYDSAGEVVQQKQLHNGGWLTTSSTYDAYGNEFTSTDALGRTTYYRYGSAYSSAYLTSQSVIVGGQNVTTSYTYDLPTGDRLTVTDPDGHTTSYRYDALGRETLVTYPGVSGVSATIEYSYDDANNVVTTTNPDGGVTKQFYDGLGRLVEAARYSGGALYSAVYYTDNWDNQVASETTATGGVYTNSYDSLGRLVKTVNPDGSFTTSSYDDVDNVVTATDQDGHQTQYAYDLDGRLTSVREYYGPSAYYLTSYTYDQSGNLLTQTDPNRQVTSYQYDDLNRVVKTTYPDGTSESLSYDAAGNLVSRTEPDGAVVAYAYDSLNRLTTVTYPGSSTVAYTYDRDGNTLSKVDSGSADYYTYDAMGRVTSETDVIAGSTYQVLYAYDKASNVLSVTYPDGSASAFTYDALGRVASVDGGAERFTYTLDDKISTIAYANGAVTSYSYDSMDRPTSIAATQAGEKVLDLNYTYDPAGNVLSVNNESYTYDALNRVASAKGPWGLMTYAYDGAGNLVSLTTNDATTAYGYGSYNRLTSVGSASLSYDANGNLVRLVNGTTAWAYSYDYENRLTGVARNGSTIETNVYDSDGKRVESIQGSAAAVYVYEGSDLIYQKDLNNGTVDKFYYANGLMLDGATGKGALYYHLDDALGSTRVVLQGTSNTVFSSDYKPFGQSYGQKGSSQFQYGGKQLDLSTGLYYFGARFYDPAIQRFVTEDSDAGSPTDPQSLDRYVYARDNPLAITDPTGHSWFGSIASALSNAAGKVEAGASGLASAATNAWNSLPPSVQAGLVIGGLIGVGIATGGLGDVAALAASGDYLATAGAALSLAAGGTAAVTDAEPELEGAAASTGVRLTNAVTGEETDLDGYPRLGANAATTTMGRWGEGIVQILRPAAQAFPRIVTSLDQSFTGDFLDGTTGIDSKVGASFTPSQAQDYADAAALGQRLMATPGVTRVGGGIITDAEYYFFQNPETGVMPNPSSLATLTSLGIKYSVYFTDYY